MCSTVPVTPPLPLPAKSVRFMVDAGLEGEDTLEVTVLSMSGDEVVIVHVARDCTVADLKTAVFMKVPELRPVAQKLILGTNVLEDSDEKLSSALHAAGYTVEQRVTIVLALVPVDPFPKLYVDDVDPLGARLTARRTDKTPKKRDFEEFLSDFVLPWDGACKECDGAMDEITRDYDFATPCKKRAQNSIKVSITMWCPACRLVFEGLQRTSM